MLLMLMAVIAHTPWGPLWPLDVHELLSSSQQPVKYHEPILQMQPLRYQEVKAFTLGHAIHKEWSCAGPTLPPRTFRSALWVGTITKSILQKRKWNVRENK